MFNLPNGSKEQIIAEWLQPELQPDLEDPVYKGLEFLLTTYLPSGNYHMYDEEVHHTNQAANDFVHEPNLNELFGKCVSVNPRSHYGKAREWLAQVKLGDVTHDIYTRELGGHQVITLSYNNCSLMSGLQVHFIKEQ